METIRLQFQPNLKEKIMTFLETLPKKEVEFTVESSSFEVTKKRVQKSFENLRSGKTTLHDIEELDKLLKN